MTELQDRLRALQGVEQRPPADMATLRRRIVRRRTQRVAAGAVASLLVVVGAVAAWPSGDDAVQVDVVDDATTTEPAPIDVDLNEFRRWYAGWTATDDTVWIGGGLLDGEGTKLADPSVVKIEVDGTVTERFEIPLGHDEFFHLGTIVPAEDELRVFGMRCGIPSGSDPGCMLRGRMATVVSFAPDGNARTIDVEGLVPFEVTDEMVGIVVLDASEDTVLVARHSNLDLSDFEAPKVDMEILSVDLVTGEFVTLGGPPGQVSNIEGVCAADEQVAAVVAPDPAGEPGAPSTLQVATVAGPGGLEWREVAPIGADAGLAPAARCSADGAVVVSGTASDGVMASFVSVNADPLVMTQQHMSRRAWHLADGGTSLIVTELRHDSAAAWEIDPATGEWRQAGHFGREAGQLPYVIKLAGRLVNIGDALSAPITGDTVSLQEVG